MATGETGRKNGRGRTTSHALMGMLSMGAGSGYDLKKLIESTIAHFWSESYGQIYPMLNQLADEGLAERTLERQAGKPDRQVYSLTPKGRDELARWLEEPPRQEGFRSELLLKLFLGSHVPVETTVRHVEAFRRQQETLLERYAAVQERLRDATHPDAAYWLMTLSYGQHRARALLDWSDETLRALRERQRPQPPARQRRTRR